MNVKINIEEKIKKSNKKFIQDELRPFLKIPSYTLNSEGISTAINHITSYISDFSESIGTYQGKINPVILADIKGKLSSQLLIYMMYDTQPINKIDDWMEDPFGAKIRILPSPLNHLGECIIARGAYNSKTPLISFLNIIKLLKKENQLPISLLLLFDGEEEMGSPTLLKLLEENKELFQKCKDAYYPAFKQDLDGRAVLKLGYKGIISLKLKVKTNNLEAHSSYANVIPNSPQYLIEFLEKVYSKNKFNIESLTTAYNLSKEEKDLINALSDKKLIQKIKQKAGIKHALIQTPEEFLYLYLFKPTFNISTLKGGYLKKGIKNSVPNSALSKIDIRYAHNISPNRIYKEIEEQAKKFLKNLPLKIKIKKRLGYGPSRVQSNTIIVKSIVKTFKQLHVEPEIWPISAAASPLSKIQNELGINYITGGLGIGGNAHASNEFIQLKSVINARLAYYHFLNNYSKLLIESS
jgi:acetylornithine deacetylase/succinyl-diaminopimelate desuccinylase-like protein